MDKPIFIFISKEIKSNIIYDFLYHNNWITKSSNINIHKVPRKELHQYCINIDKKAIGISKEDISIDYIINDNYKKVYENEEEDITIYSIVSRKANNYKYIPYITKEPGTKYNFYNIEKEYHKLAYKDSFIYHDEKSYEGYILDIIKINNNKNILEELLGNKKIKANYKLELISDINNLEDVISYIFSINKFKYNSFELIDADESLSVEINRFIKIIKSNYGNLLSFYKLNSNLADKISSFAININMWCIIFKNSIMIIDYGTYE